MGASGRAVPGGAEMPGYGRNRFAANALKPADPGRDMAEHDNKPHKNVVPSGKVIGSAIAQQLNEFYGELLAEDLPDELSALARQLAIAMARAREKEEDA